MNNKKITGYPSIDKPWLKYYSAEAINAPLPQKTLWEYVYEDNKDLAARELPEHEQPADIRLRSRTKNNSTRNGDCI